MRRNTSILLKYISLIVILSVITVMLGKAETIWWDSRPPLPDFCSGVLPNNSNLRAGSFGMPECMTPLAPPPPLLVRVSEPLGIILFFAAPIVLYFSYPFRRLQLLSSTRRKFFIHSLLLVATFALIILLNSILDEIIF